ncbi:PREDICTED: enhancer of rudimentary homolog isoform X2 [Tarenaya hassleriana]|uniref:enhancer of rudimentary homolog isoform X2 n=1 Tax=Tarenaya hassleriana TaxID=28532 RepID=UPI00053C2AC9|nr:PREDICTED: enhancer of rudimentary homolog isoform X2 [Tarenaya hassleriana]
MGLILDCVGTFSDVQVIYQYWFFYKWNREANTNSRHTIILMQTSPSRATRTFMDYESISQAMDDLYNFIDGLADMSALVYDHSRQAYLPYDRQWIKQKTFHHLKRLANGPR